MVSKIITYLAKRDGVCPSAERVYRIVTDNGVGLIMLLEEMKKAGVK